MKRLLPAGELRAARAWFLRDTSFDECSRCASDVAGRDCVPATVHHAVTRAGFCDEHWTEFEFQRGSSVDLYVERPSVHGNPRFVRP